MELLYYLLKVSACLVLFFAFYLLVLQKLTFFKINRFYLLATLLLSFVIPALNITIEREIARSPLIQEEQIDFSATEIQAIDTQQTFIGKENRVEKVEAIDWLALTPYAYILIASVILSLGLRKLILLIKHIEPKAPAVNGLKVISKAVGFTNCSFFNYVFIDEQNLTENELAILLQHEKVHAQQYHSIDKIVMMFAKAALWFNPVVYLWDKALEQMHEYEADEATSTHFGSKEYASLLLKLVVGQNRSLLVHNFVKSPVKERIKMLFNSKSKNMKKLMYLLVAPVLLGLLWGFTVKVVEVNIHNNKEINFPNESNSKNKLSNVEENLFDKELRAKVKGVEKTEVGEIIRFEYGKKIIPVFNISGFASFKIGEEMLITLSGKLNELKVMDAKSKILKDLYMPCYTLSKLKTAKGELLYKAQYSFIETENIKLAGGDMASMIYVKSPKGKKMNALLLKEMSVKFLINNKLYTLDQAKRFELGFAQNLSVKQGVGRGNYYDVKGVGVNDYVFWFGKEPAVLPSVSKSKVAAAKYTGKSVFGKVLNYTYSKDDNKINGFVIQQKADEKLWIYIGKQFGKEVSNDIKVADDVKVNAFDAYFSKGTSFPQIGSSTVIKNGKVIFDRAKYVVDARPEGVKTDYKTLAKMEYQASDSVVATRDRTIVDLYGKARLNLDSITLKAAHININNITRIVTAYNAEIRSDYNNLNLKAPVVYYNLDTKKYTAKSPKGDR